MTCWWPSTTFEDLPKDCSFVPVEDRWPSFFKKVQVFSMIYIFSLQTCISSTDPGLRSGTETREKGFCKVNKGLLTQCCHFIPSFAALLGAWVNGREPRVCSGSLSFVGDRHNRDPFKGHHKRIYSLAVRGGQKKGVLRSHRRRL